MPYGGLVIFYGRIGMSVHGLVILYSRLECLSKALLYFTVECLSKALLYFTVELECLSKALLYFTVELECLCKALLYFNGHGYTFRGSISAEVVFNYFLTGVRSKRKVFAPLGSKFFPFRVDLFSKGMKCAGKQTLSHISCVPKYS